MNDILIAPVLTEKTSRLSEEGRHYAFRVASDANKIEIRKAIEERYNVGVTSVRTIAIRPKSKVQMTRRGYMVGKTPRRKKAIVTVREGQTIDIVGDLPSEEN